MMRNTLGDQLGHLVKGLRNISRYLHPDMNIGVAYCNPCNSQVVPMECIMLKCWCPHGVCYSWENEVNGNKNEIDAEGNESN